MGVEDGIGARVSDRSTRLDGATGLSPRSLDGNFLARGGNATRCRWLNRKLRRIAGRRRSSLPLLPRAGDPGGDVGSDGFCLKRGRQLRENVAPEEGGRVLLMNTSLRHFHPRTTFRRSWRAQKMLPMNEPGLLVAIMFDAKYPGGRSLPVCSDSQVSDLEKRGFE